MHGYIYEWDLETGGYVLVPSAAQVGKEIRPVFHEELDLFGLNQYWTYPKSKSPLLWAEGTRRYFYRGDLIAEAQGGGFFTRPTFKVYTSGLRLMPVNIPKMVEKNRALVDGFLQTSLEFIVRTYREYKKKSYNQFVVAFSGGKDSLVLLDLVQRALSPHDFVVIFGDTGMELSSTYESVQRAMEHWSNLKFYTAKSRMEPEKTWIEFGPPSRIHRWCCSVHKSVPTILLLRSLAQNESIRTVVFDGVRREESEARSGYLEITENGKHISQVNASPILQWNSASLFLYIFERDILLNKAYRLGMNRVGCAVCPMSSSWRDYIGQEAFKEDVDVLLGKVREYAQQSGINPTEIDRYIEIGGWKGRSGGRGLENGGNHVFEHIDDDTITFQIRKAKADWLECSKILGNTILQGEGRGEQEIAGRYFPFSIRTLDAEIRVVFEHFSQMDRMMLCYLRAVANKVAYCVGCQTCQVECQQGAFHVNDQGISINDNCKHCFHCLTYKDKGCLAARSLGISIGGKSVELKGMNRYQTFGLRKDWLLSFFSKGVEAFWSSHELGNRQYDSFRVWLRESGIMENNQLTKLGQDLKRVGVSNWLVWAVVWTNLAYNSTIIRWYVTKVPKGTVATKEELISLLGEEYSHSTRENAVTSLLEVLRHTIIGSDLRIGLVEYQGNSHRVKSVEKAGWDKPDELAILYALYRYAEETDRHYQFTMTELRNRNEESKGIDPMTLFGTEADEIERILRGLAEIHPDFIKVDFMRDLDSIRLNSEKKSEDVLDLA